MRPRFSIPFLALLLVTSSLHAAVFMVPSDAQMIKDSDAILLGLVSSQRTERLSDGDIVTFTQILPERVMKGALDHTQPVEVRDLGGIAGMQAMAVSGGVTYAPGERVLVFLSEHEGDYWTTYGMSLGKMTSMRMADGDRILIRAVGSDVVGLDADGLREHVEFPRMEDAFLTYVDRIVKRIPSKADPFRSFEYDLGPLDAQLEDETGYLASRIPIGDSSDRQRGERFVPQVTSHFPPSAYTFGTFRWSVFDAGGSVTYYVSGSQPGYDSVGTAQRALAGWTNDPSSNVRLVYGGTRSAAFVQDGVNAIVYNSATDVPAGAIGYSKWYANAQHTYKGETFYSISEGDVVMKSGLSVSAAVFDEAVAHEVGHTLGFRHSDQGTPASNDAIMRSVVSGRFGATPGPWDVEALSHVYGSGTTTPPPPACTAPAITAQPASRTITAGQTTTLSVTATGTAPLSYQWYIGSSGSTTSPIAGATGPSVTVNPQTSTSYWVRVTNSCGSVNSTTATVTVSAPPPATTTRVRGDFNFDSRPDIVWRNTSTGDNRIWLMNGTTVTGTLTPPRLDVAWRLVGAGENNGDGRQDLIWRNMNTGANVIWNMNGASLISSYPLPTVSLDWEVMSVFHYDGINSTDLLWRHRGTTQMALWLMSGSTLVSTQPIPSLPLDWVSVGAADFNLDGWSDFAWRNVNTNQVVLWYMAGINIASTAPLGTVPASWEAGAVSDYTGDGWPDIVWRNTATGAVNMWVVSGGVVRSTAALPTEGNLAWRIFAPR
ncbi:MAG TPA: FG-GAP-like repeat-containing protein [Thermoanaerobaculia bacterium]|jgi:hypothetical protein